MKYFLSFTIIFLLFFKTASSQDDKKSGGFAIKVSPLTLTEPNFPLAQGSIEIQLTDQWSIQQESGD